MKKLFGIFLLLCSFMAVSCSHLFRDDEARRLEEALGMAGSNRAQLEKVLSHYAGHPEKYSAACWLIANMPMHHAKTGDGLADYRRYFEEASDQSRTPKEIVDSLDSIYGRPDTHSLKAVYDINVIDSAYLVSNIDAAFEAREKYPWGNNVRWEDFLEFVLPYRIGDEPLSDWRHGIMEEYGGMIDSIAAFPEAATPRLASDLIYKEWIRKKKFRWTSGMPSGPRVGPEIAGWKTGSCRDKADGMIYILRAAGLPAAYHEAPLRGDLNDSHSWGVIIDSDGSPWLPEQHADSAYKSIVPAAKVLCETYSINRGALQMSAVCMRANPSLCNPFMRDATGWYLPPERRSRLKMPVDNLRNVSEGDTVYIALSSRQQWIPVGFGVADGDSVDFGYVGERTICVAGILGDSGFVPASQPFCTSHQDSLTFYIPGAVRPVNIYSKCTVKTGDFAARMIGGVFETSDSPDFANPDTLHMVRRLPKRLFTSVETDPDIPAARYVRYRGADKTNCDVAEIAFFGDLSDSIPMQGRILMPEGFNPSGPNHDFTNVFDGDPYTSFYLQERSGGWVGLDFGRPRRIARIVYSPRNRGNFIRDGYTYELFYFSRDRGWISCGRGKADSDMLVMEAPEGALLYLRCLDGGKAERIFEYDPEDDVQIFW